MWQTFWNWFLGSGAGWLFGALGFFWGVYVTLRRPSANQVVVQEVSSTRLLNIHHLHKQRLSILYTDPNGDQETILGLNQKKIVIYNNGPSRIDNISLTLRLQDSVSGADFNGFTRLVIGESDHNVKLKPLVSPLGKTNSGFQLEIDYLNPFTIYKDDCVSTYLLSDGDLEFDILEKNGRDLSIKLFMLKNLSNLNKWRKRIYISLLLSLIIASILLISRVFIFIATLPNNNNIFSLLSNPDFGTVAILAVIVTVLVLALQRALQMAFDLFVVKYFKIQPLSRFEDKIIPASQLRTP